MPVGKAPPVAKQCLQRRNAGVGGCRHSSPSSAEESEQKMLAEMLGDLGGHEECSSCLLLDSL